MSLAMINNCRACLLEKDSQELCDWYMPMDDINEPLTIEECFQLCTQLDIKKTNSTSSYVNNMHYLCLDCVHELIYTFRFIRKAQRSDHELCVLSEKRRNRSANQTEEFELVNIQGWGGSSSRWDDSAEIISHKEYLAVEDIEEQTDIVNSRDLSTHEVQQSTTSLKEDGSSDISEYENYLHSKIEIIDVCQLGDSVENHHLKDCSKYVQNNIEVPEGEVSLQTFKKFEKQYITQSFDESKISICEYCSKSFKESELKQHVCRFPSKNKLLCYACPSTFNDAVGLKNHEDTHQPNRKRTISCEQCHRTFFTQRAYQNHSKTHEENRVPKFKCDQCEKCFFHNGSLKLHKQYHTGLSFECNVCSKQFPRSVDLKIHLRSHSDETPYKCPKCNKCFRYVQVFNKHVRHHEGHRYECNLCGKEYAHQSTMLQHRKEHTGLPLRCSICDKGFVKKSKMRRHIAGVHKVGDIEEIDQLIVKVKTKNIYRGRIVDT